ncbi:MAG TPA: hypothetical protein VFQ88_09695, partial [Nevskiaceae bacterium]|nr:hypothetical protein [Nevskiaceae bacterium]
MNKTDGSVSLMSQEQGRAINHLEALRARLLRGGRLTKFKGILASIAPTLAGVTLAAGVAVAPAAMAVTVNDPAGPVSQTVNNDDVNVTNVGTLSVSSGSAIDITHTGTGNVTVTSTPTGSITNTDTGTPAAGVRVSNNTAGGPNSNVTVNLNDVTAVSTSQAAVDIGNRSVGGTTSLTATGTITSSGGHAIRINGVDGNAGYGAMAGPLTINVQDLKGAADGIQIVNSIGTAAAPQAIKITTGDINAGNVGIETYNGSGALLNGNTTITTGTITSTADAISIRSGTGTVGITTGDIDAGGNGINLASQINSVDGATTVKTGTIKAGGEGVAIESGDDAKNYAIDVTTGDVTTGGTGFSVNQSGVGSLSVTTGNVNAGTATASNINGFQNAGGYGIRMDSDPHGTTTATQSAFNLTAGNVTVKDTTGALAGTGVAFGTINNGGNGNTTATVGNIQAGTGLIYNRNGTGAVNLTTGDITASTGDGLNVGNDITHNDVSVKTGNVSAKGYGIYANTQVDAGKLTVTAGDVTAGNTGLYLVHSGTKDFTVTAGDVTSTGAGGVFLWNDGSNPATSPTTLKATVDSITATGIGAELRKDSVGDLSFESTGLVKSTGGAGIQLDNFNNGNVNIAADAGVDAKGNGIDLGGSVNGGANVGTVAITSGGTIKAGGIGINADTGSVTTGTTINVADMDTGSTGVNWINSGTKPFTFTSTGTITAGGIGINLTNDGGSTTSPDGQATINVNNITTPNNMAISVNSAATKGTTINVNGAIHTTAANDLTGDGMHVTEATGPLNINIAKGASITSYTNTMEIQNTNATAPTTVNVDGKLISSADGGAVDGVIWDWNHPNSTLNANINDGSTVQAADKAGFAVTDNSGDSNVIVAKTAAVTGGFRMGAGNDAVTFNGTDMTSVYTLDGGGGSTYTTGGAGDVLTLNDVSNFTRNLQTAGQGIQNWDVVALNGGKADLQGTLTLSPTGEFINGKDASGNPAVLTIGAGHAGDNLTITGNYVGAGGDLTLDVDSSVGAPTGSTTPGVAGPTAADTLNVGGSTSGVTAISLNDVTPTGDVSSQKDINVVNVAGTSDPNAFVLADGPAVMGGHAYLLQQGDSASHLSGTVAAADLATVKNWYLNPEPCPAGGFNSSNNTGTTLGCKTDDVLTTNGSTTVT